MKGIAGKQACEGRRFNAHPQPVLLVFEQGAQHPRGLFMNLHTLGQQVRSWLVADFIQQREDAPGGAGNRFLAFDQLLDHVFSARHALFFLD